MTRATRGTGPETDVAPRETVVHAGWQRGPVAPAADRTMEERRAGDAAVDGAAGGTTGTSRPCGCGSRAAVSIPISSYMLAMSSDG